MNFEIHKYILLTGAGFTRNFDGFLAKEKRDQIFNSEAVENFPPLRQLLIDESEGDYESLYQRVVYGDYSAQLKEALTKAVMSAYGELDKAICYFYSAQRSGAVSSYPHIHNLKRYFLSHFDGGAGGNVVGYFFTLNQDLFIERWDDGEQFWIIPGMPKQSLRFSHDVHGRAASLPPEYRLTVPDAEAVQKISSAYSQRISSPSRFYYVKLHGSLNWWSSGEKQAMVIGGNKAGQIAREPLLQWYTEEIFKKVLSCPNRHLWVVGYSFRDEHINNVIAESITNHALNLYTISPSDTTTFTAELAKSPYGEILLARLCKHFPYALKDVYPADGRDTLAAQQIHKALQQ